MFSITVRGDTRKAERFLTRMMNQEHLRQLDGLAKKGVAALAGATPVDSGTAAAAWDYTIKRSGRSVTISWTNSNIENGFPVVVMLQYGHGTGTGGFVSGQDFINPAIRPIFDQIADGVWKVVTSA